MDKLKPIELTGEEKARAKELLSDVLVDYTLHLESNNSYAYLDVKDLDSNVEDAVNEYIDQSGSAIRIFLQLVR